MGFYWICPLCKNKNFYRGGLTTEAVTTCSACSLKLRIWKHRIVAKPQDNHNKPQKKTIIYTPQSFMAKVLKMLVDDLNTTLLEDKKKRLINVLSAKDKKGNNYAWVRDCIMILVDYCIQKGLIS